MGNTLIDAMHENNKHKRTISTWECLEKLSASIECLDLDQEQHDAFIKIVKGAIETSESAGFTKGKAIAEREYNSDLRTLIQRLETENIDEIIKKSISK